jgi:hypothetical protein
MLAFIACVKPLWMALDPFDGAKRRFSAVNVRHRYPLVPESPRGGCPLHPGLGP